MKKYIPTIIILLFLTSCKTPQPALENRDFYTMLNLLFQEPKSGEVVIYHKTINEGRVAIKDQIKYEKLNANFPVSGGRIDFENLMTQEDLNFLKGEVEDLKERKVNPQFLNFPVRLVKKKSSNSLIHYFSEPLFTRDKKLAFIFRKAGSGGESFSVFEKVDSDWKFFCTVVLYYD